MNKLLGIVAVLLVQYAIALGSVTVVNALAGVQYALMFVFIYGLTKWYPRIFKEYFTAHEIAVEITAIALVMVGLGLLVFKG